jgi:hypothetical protein
MRTVSFSSAPVRDSLTNDFVCYSLNTDGDPSAGLSVSHAPSDSPGFCTQGIGKQNVQCLFLTPDGRIFHTASGFQGPADLEVHLGTARRLFAAIQDDPEQAERTVRDFHQEQLAAQPTDGNVRLPLPRSFGEMMTQFSSGGSRDGQFSALMNGMFDFPRRDAANHDARYMVEHPLISLSEFQRNPRELVGYECSAFVSVGNGGASGGQIGR